MQLECLIGHARCGNLSLDSACPISSIRLGRLDEFFPIFLQPIFFSKQLVSQLDIAASFFLLFVDLDLSLDKIDFRLEFLKYGVCYFGTKM